MRRGGFVILSVLVIVTIALFMATGVLFMVQAESSGSVASSSRVQSRAIGMSAIEVIVGELNDQREGLLEGELPQLFDEYELYDDGDRLGIVRLIPMGPDGELFVAESSKLDLNSVDQEMLEGIEMIGPAMARAIIEHRDGLPGRRFQSELQLLDVPGIDAEMLYGPLEDLTLTDDVQFGAAMGLGERVGQQLGMGELAGLLDLFTVYAFEPALQRSGRLRINLNTPWSDELGHRVDERFGEGTSRVLEQLFGEYTFENDGVLYELFNRFRTDPEEWPNIIDALSSTPDQFHFGRLNINEASYEALLALPGVDEAMADELISVREQLDADSKATIAWPAIEGLIPTEAYVDLAELMTTRSWTYRVRIAAGEVPSEEADLPIEHPVIYELVIDLSAPKPRIAYLRDVTLLQTATQVALQATELGDGGDDEFWDEWDAEEGLDPSGSDGLASSSSDGGMADEMGSDDAMGPGGFDDDWPDDSSALDDDDSDDDDSSADGSSDGASGRSGNGAGRSSGGGTSRRSRVGRWTGG